MDGIMIRLVQHHGIQYNEIKWNENHGWMEWMSSLGRVYLTHSVSSATLTRIALLDQWFFEFHFVFTMPRPAHSPLPAHCSLPHCHLFLSFTIPLFLYFARSLLQWDHNTTSCFYIWLCIDMDAHIGWIHRIIIGWMWAYWWIQTNACYSPILLFSHSRLNEWIQ